MKHKFEPLPRYRKAELNYKKISSILQKNYGSTSIIEDHNELIAEAKTFEKIYHNDEKIIGLFHFNNFTLSYLSGNASKYFECALTKDSPINNKALFYGLEPSHSEFPFKAFDWIKLFTNNFSAKEGQLMNAHNFFCGVKFINKKKEVKSYFIRQHIRTQAETGLPLTSVCFLTDITHLYKADFYWARMERGKHKEITSFRTSEKIKEQKDIITPREKQVLQLISAKKESKEISSILNISTNTVDSHRKAMIKRSGAKDTTALIQLCKMAKVL